MYNYREYFLDPDTGRMIRFGPAPDTSQIGIEVRRIVKKLEKWGALDVADELTDMANLNRLHLPPIWPIQKNTKEKPRTEVVGGSYRQHHYHDIGNGQKFDTGEELMIRTMDEYGPFGIPTRYSEATNTEAAVAIHEIWHRRFRDLKLPLQEEEKLCLHVSTSYKRRRKLNEKKHYTPFELEFMKTGRMYTSEILNKHYQN